MARQGDTVFLKSLSFTHVSRAFPVGQCTFVLLTVIIAALFLSEPFSVINILGGALIIGGIYLITGVNCQPTTPGVRSAPSKGWFLTFCAALAWTSSAVVLKLGVSAFNPILTSAIRTLAGAAALTIFQYEFRVPEESAVNRNKDFWKILLMVLSGILGYGLSGMAYVIAMQRIGAGRTVLIVSLTPVFVLILSVLFLKERPTIRSLSGVISCVIGVISLTL